MTEGKDWTIETHMRVTREMEIGGNEMLRNQRNHTQEIKLQIRQVKQEVTNETWHKETLRGGSQNTPRYKESVINSDG